MLENKVSHKVRKDITWLYITNKIITILTWGLDRAGCLGCHLLERVRLQAQS